MTTGPSKTCPKHSSPTESPPANPTASWSSEPTTSPGHSPKETRKTTRRTTRCPGSRQGEDQGPREFSPTASLHNLPPLTCVNLNQGGLGAQTETAPPFKFYADFADPARSLPDRLGPRAVHPGGKAGTGLSSRGNVDGAII